MINMFKKLVLFVLVGIFACPLIAQVKLPVEHTDFSDKQLLSRPISSHFGVCTHFVRSKHGWTPDMVPMIRNMGMSTYREEVSWGSVEKEKGIYKVPDIADGHINQAVKLGMEPLVLLLYSNKIYENPLDPEAFANYANHVIEHFKGRVKYFEIFNEPDNFVFRKQYGGMWNGKGNGEEKYAKWLVKFAEFASIVTKRIKEKNPDAFLVGYSTSPPAAHHMFNIPEAWKYLDALAIHPYSKRVPPEIRLYGGDAMNKRDGVKVADDNHSVESVIRLYREKLDAMGLNKMEIWVTEAGNQNAQMVKKAGNFRGMTQFGQAAFNTRKALLCLGYGVKKFYYYDYYDDGPDKKFHVHNFGLIDRDYQPKLAFYAAQRLNRLLYDEVKPIKLDVTVDRPFPWSENGQTVHENAAIKYLETPQVHCFERKDGSTIVFFWRPGRIYNDYQEELANLTINMTGSLIEAGRVVTGEKIELKLMKKEDRCEVMLAPYGSDPLYLIFK